MGIPGGSRWAGISSLTGWVEGELQTTLIAGFGGGGGDGGGGGAGLDRTELDKFLASVYRKAQDILATHENCSKLFGTDQSRANGWNPMNVLKGMFFGEGGLGSIRYGSTLPGSEMTTLPTVTVGNGPFGIGLGASITISESAAKDYISGSGYVGATNELALSLLHELGHAYSLLSPRGSGGSQILPGDILPPIQRINNDLINQNCR